MIKKYKYTFEELQIVPADLQDLLGFENNEIPEPFPTYIETALASAPSLCNIQGAFRIFDTVDVNTANNTIQVETELFSPAKTVTTQLKKSTKVALFACTAGAGISEHAHKISAENDPMLAYVLDILGSVTVEKATDKIQAALLEEVSSDGLGISDRYSPGYCEWSVGEQQKLFSLLPENICGIQLSESSLMHPIKSVSGIIGIGEGLRQKGYQCKWCTDRNCIYGKMDRKKKEAYRS